MIQSHCNEKSHFKHVKILKHPFLKYHRDLPLSRATLQLQRVLSNNKSTAGELYCISFKVATTLCVFKAHSSGKTVNI